MMENKVFGYKICPSWLKKKYREAVKFNCQICNRNEKETGTLQIHRIKRGNMGGLYTVCPINHRFSNVRIVCKSCHKMLHQNEFGVSKSV